MSESPSHIAAGTNAAGTPLAYGRPGAPLVVILHDWYGRLPWLEPYAQALADGGFRALLPDLYDGSATVDRDEAERLSDALDLETSIRNLTSAIDAERANGSQRVGLIGFSLGTWIALQAAQRGLADAVVAYYGTGPAGILPVPLLMHLAERDEFEPAAETAAFIEQLEKHGTSVTVHLYPGTEHNFANGTVPGLLDEASAGLASARTAAFLASQLGS